MTGIVNCECSDGVSSGIAGNCQLQALPHCFVAQVITMTNY